ncbi:transmembrane adaptor Erv26 [Syncephalis fuscata]|nr:transmembrane adaptor Erv26 [Syncephalis fuscata]
MAVVLHLLAYIGLFSALILVTMSLACGLYYLSELVEEHTVLAGRAIRWMTWTVAAIQLALLFDGLPLLRVFYSLACLITLSTNMLNFPNIRLSSPTFILGCLMTVVNHFLWFQYFSAHPATLLQVAAFFGICVWLVPFAYFLSLSTGDNSLPTFGQESSSGSGNRGRVSLVKNLIDTMTGRSSTPAMTSGLPSGVNFRKDF